MVQIPDLSIINDYLEQTLASPAVYDPASNPSTIVS